MELSVEQIREQLQTLLNPGAGPQPDGSYVYTSKWVRDLFPAGHYCVFVDETDGKLYKQGYSVSGLEVVLEGQPVEVFIVYMVPGEAALTPSTEPVSPPAEDEGENQPTVAARFKQVLRFGMTEHLYAALQEAAAAGDVEAAAAIAGWMKKKQAEMLPGPSNPTNPASEPPNSEPLPPPNQLDQPGPLYERVRDQLEAAYPGHEYVNEDEGSVTIALKDEQGNETYWRIPVAVAEDGSASLGEPEQVQPPEAPPNPAVAATSEEGPPTAINLKNPQRLNQANHRRALLSPIGPKLLEGANAKNEIWVNIVNLGEYEHPEYGTITFTEEHFKQWKANLERGVMGGRCEDGTPCIATDYGHAMDEALPPEMQKASGYIKDLKLEDNRVYALIEFTPRAIEGIKNKEWSWFSVSVVDSLTDQKTGEDVGSVLMGGALTNRPFIPDLEPIRLSDLRPSRTAQLQRELAAREAEIKRLQREKFDAEVKALLSALEQARIPPSVIGLVRPLLEADFGTPPTIKLARSAQPLPPGRAALEALMELARVGLVPTGEHTGRPQSVLGITLEQAVAEVEEEWRKEGKQNYRRKDLYIAARRKYPHLREN